MNVTNIRKYSKTPKDLIENRVAFSGPNAELSVYDTYQQSTQVGFDSDEVTLCAMVSGKKVIHYNDHKIAFMPNECFLMSSGQHIDIDFPIAKQGSPTTCLAICLQKKTIKQVCDRLNIARVKTPHTPEIHLHDSDHLHHPLNFATQELLNRLINLFSENELNRNMLLELGIQELIARMLQQQSRNFLLSEIANDPEKSGLHLALNTIESNLDQTFDVDMLSKIACMSRSKFFREFKQSVGCTPSEYTFQKRVENASHELLKGKTVSQAALESGFVNMSHFSKRFRQHLGMSPKDFFEKKQSTYAAEPHSIATYPEFGLHN